MGRRNINEILKICTYLVKIGYKDMGVIYFSWGRCSDGGL